MVAGGIAQRIAQRRLIQPARIGISRMALALIPTEKRQAWLRPALVYVAFISIGLPDGLLGTAWPSMHSYFQVRVDAIGALLLTYTAGYLLASFSSGWVMSRMRVGALLAASCGVTTLSLAGYALAPAWGWMVALGVLAGLGAGAIDAGLNTYAAKRFTPRAINWMHASYAAGAALGPLLITRVLMSGLHWQAGYGIVAAAQVALALCFASTRNDWQDSPRRRAETAEREQPQAALWETLRAPAVWAGNAVFFVYTGIEAAVGVWAYTLLTELHGVSPMTAGFWVSLYWGGLTAGRLLLGAVAVRHRLDLMLSLCLTGVLMGVGLLWLELPQLGAVSLALIGLAAGPVFPTLIALAPERAGQRHAANAIGFHIAAATLGQSLLPALAGVLGARLGLGSILRFLLVAVLVLSLIHAGVLSHRRAGGAVVTLRS
jgi:fucose permease